VSHEAIYNCIYAQPVGELKRELTATQRHAHTNRNKGKGRRAQIPDMVSIQVRPAEGHALLRIQPGAARINCRSDQQPGPGMGRAYDPHWRSIGNSGATAHKIPPSFIETQGVALQI